MLEGPMKESAASTITIHDASYAGFMGLLEYLYTESVGILSGERVDSKAALELLCLADQYLIPDLKAQCEVAILACVQADNVCQLLELADIRRTPLLRKECMEYIFNNFAAVIIQDAFLELSKHILKEIFSDLAQRGCSIGHKNVVGNNSPDSASSK